MASTLSITDSFPNCCPYFQLSTKQRKPSTCALPQTKHMRCPLPVTVPLASPGPQLPLGHTCTPFSPRKLAHSPAGPWVLPQEACPLPCWPMSLCQTKWWGWLPQYRQLWTHTSALLFWLVFRYLHPSQGLAIFPANKRLGQWHKPSPWPGVPGRDFLLD